MQVASQDKTIKKHVVIVGAGFAGLECARTLASDKNLYITLIDRHNFHVFQPLLYQVSTGILSPSNAAFNLRGLLHEYPNVEVKMSEICRVDLETKTVYGCAGDSYVGDYLVLAAGAQANFFDTPGASTEAYPLYSLQDAERLRSKLITICEKAELEGKDLTDGLNVVVVGGGATGVEVAGALADLVRRTPKSLYKNFDLRRSTISIVDPGETVLGPFKERSQNYAGKVLKQRGIVFHFGSRVQEVKADSVVLSNGEHLPAHVTIWAGGIKGAQLSGSLGLTPGHGGRVDVDSKFRVPGYSSVFALGDFANYKEKDGTVLPQLASVAKQAGHQCAKNILAEQHGQGTKPFQYLDKGIMAMIGRGAAVAEVGRRRLVVLGHLAFLAWLGVHVLLLDSMWVMFQTITEWVSDYFGMVSVGAVLDREVQEKQ